jgi:hypothetical protein
MSSGRRVWAASALAALAIALSLAAGCSTPDARIDLEARRFVEGRFLVPIKDNQGNAFDESRFEWLETQLARQFGGYTLEGIFPGGWHDGRRLLKEESRRYVVALERQRIRELLTFLRQVKKEFRQESLYVSFTEGRVFFL